MTFLDTDPEHHKQIWRTWAPAAILLSHSPHTISYHQIEIQLEYLCPSWIGLRPQRQSISMLPDGIRLQYIIPFVSSRDWTRFRKLYLLSRTLANPRKSFFFYEKLVRISRQFPRGSSFTKAWLMSSCKTCTTGMWGERRNDT